MRPTGGQWAAGIAAVATLVTAIGGTLIAWKKGDDAAVELELCHEQIDKNRDAYHQQINDGRDALLACDQAYREHMDRMFDRLLPSEEIGDAGVEDVATSEPPLAVSSPPPSLSGSIVGGALGHIADETPDEEVYDEWADPPILEQEAYDDAVETWK